jgi:hypothetical protein
MANAKNYIVVIHGIGEHTEKSIKKEVKTTLNGISGSFNKNVEVKAVTYNQVFTDWIEKAKSDWKTAIDALSSTNHFSSAKDFLKDLIDREPDFLETHVMDVALYLSTVGIKVQLEVALQLTKILTSYIEEGDTRQRRIVLMGHSMGTAVVHDSLHKMIIGGFEDDRANKLEGMSVRINSLYQLANTSRLLKTTIDPTTTASGVRPYPGGIIDRMYNVNNAFDPIPQVKSFKIDPVQWIPETSFPDTLYHDIKLKAVLDKDVHALTHYLKDPKLYLPLLHELDTGFVYPRNARQIKLEYDKTTDRAIEVKLQAKADAAKKRLSDSASDVLKAFLEAQMTFI